MKAQWAQDGYTYTTEAGGYHLSVTYDRRTYDYLVLDAAGREVGRNRLPVNRRADAMRGALAAAGALLALKR